METVDVSICIATYRRPRGLARLLESLGRLKLPDRLCVEVIVVDNDAASDPARPAAAVPGCALRWLDEPRCSIPHARNRAVDAAAGRWLAFVDDDEVVDEGWLAAYWACVQQRDCDGYFGPVLPRLEAVTTPWLDPAVFYTRPRHANRAPITSVGARTGNAFVRRSLFREARFDPAFGRSGGSDTLLFRGLVARGARFEWCDAAIVHEYLPPERHRLAWLVQRAFRGGCVHARVERRLGRVRTRVGAAVLAAGAAGVLLASAAALLPAGRAQAARALLRAVVQLGKGWGHLGGRFEEYRG